MKRLLAFSALILLTATCQDAGRITQPDGEPLSGLPGPNFNVTTTASGGLTFQSVSPGGTWSCGVTTAGAAYCWGDNDFWQLGDGTTTNSNVPVLVDFIFSP